MLCLLFSYQLTQLNLLLEDYNLSGPRKYYVDSLHDERDHLCRDLEHRTRLETEASPCSGGDGELGEFGESEEAKSKSRANSGTEIIDDSVTNKKGESEEGFPCLKANAN